MSQEIVKTFNKFSVMLFNEFTEKEKKVRDVFIDQLNKRGRVPLDIRIEDLGGKEIELNSFKRYSKGTKIIKAWSTYVGKKTAFELKEIMSDGKLPTKISRGREVAIIPRPYNYLSLRY